MNRVLGAVAINAGGEAVTRVVGLPHENYFLHDALLFVQIVVALATIVFISFKIGQMRARMHKERMLQWCPLNKLEPEVILERLAAPANGKRKLLEDCPICKMSETELARIVKFSKELD